MHKINLKVSSLLSLAFREPDLNILHDLLTCFTFLSILHIFSSATSKNVTWANLMLTDTDNSESTVEPWEVNFLLVSHRNWLDAILINPLFHERIQTSLNYFSELIKGFKKHKIKSIKEKQNCSTGRDSAGLRKQHLSTDAGEKFKFNSSNKVTTYTCLWSILQKLMFLATYINVNPNICKLTITSHILEVLLREKYIHNLKNNTYQEGIMV